MHSGEVISTLVSQQGDPVQIKKFNYSSWGPFIEIHTSIHIYTNIQSKVINNVNDTCLPTEHTTQYNSIAPHYQ